MKTVIIGFALAAIALHAQEADLANHLWDVPGDDDRGSVNASFHQPFVFYITPTKTTFSQNAETTFDWHNDQWTVPFNLVISQLMTIGNQPVQAFVGARYYAEKPANAPEWGLRCACRSPQPPIQPHGRPHEKYGHIYSASMPAYQSFPHHQRLV